MPKQKIRKAVITAAGRGSRIQELPLTRVLPKPMLPILNKPIIEHIIEKLIPLGVEQVYLIVGSKGQVIEDYFDDGSDWGIKISYIEQLEPKGIAHAILQTRPYIDEPFMVVLGDDFSVTKSFENLLETFFEKEALAVTGVVNEENIESLRRTNCVQMDESGKILKTNEKPENPDSKIRGCGVYVFHPKVFEYIERTPVSLKRGQKEITDTLHIMAREGRVYGTFIDGVNININTLQDLVSAMHYALRLHDGP